MEIKTLTLNAIPEKLRRLSSPPQLLYTSGEFEALLRHPCVAVVGSRKISNYGRQVTYDLAGKLAGQGVVIISGLALGVDAVAHRAALDAGGLTIAVLPGPLETIYPRSHQQLAEQILASGGALISEYPAGTPPLRHNFIARNRLVSGLADALLITEAADRSGTLHTARFALEQGREVLAVPGNITSPTSAGTNNLIRAGAAPATSADDVLHALGLQLPGSAAAKIRGRNPEEQAVIDLLSQGVTDGDELQQASQLDIPAFNQTLTMLELSGTIRPLGANQWSLA